MIRSHKWLAGWMRTQDNSGKRYPMTRLIEISPEAERELIRRAAAQGLDVQAYTARLLEQAVHVPAATKTLSLSQRDATLREMFQFSHKIPVLSDEGLYSENVYADHDRCRTSYMEMVTVSKSRVRLVLCAERRGKALRWLKDCRCRSLIADQDEDLMFGIKGFRRAVATLPVAVG